MFLSESIGGAAYRLFPQRPKVGGDICGCGKKLRSRERRTVPLAEINSNVL